jgi:hypothetical protein
MNQSQSSPCERVRETDALIIRQMSVLYSTKSPGPWTDPTVLTVTNPSTGDKEPALALKPTCLQARSWYVPRMRNKKNQKISSAETSPA